MIRFVRDEAAHAISGRDLQERVAALLLGLDELHLSRGARVAVLSQNRWEWILIDLATAGRGVANVSLDPGWSDTMVARVLNHAQAEVVFAETGVDVARIQQLAAEIPTIRALVAIDAVEERAAAGVRSLSDVLDAGLRGRDGRRVEALLASVQPDDLATVIFTGGSTGQPKGVLRTHGNVLSSGWAWFPWMGEEAEPDPAPDDALLNPLSFCHSAGRWWYQMALARGATLALPSSASPSLQDLALLAPTHMATVPRVVLNIHQLLLPHVASILERLEALGAEDPERAPLRERLSDVIRERLGGRLRHIVFGGAALAPELIEFFEEAGIRVRAGYGGTEAGIVAVQSRDEPRGTVGKPKGAEVRLEAGEILVRGPAVTPGYLANPDATAAARGDNGWWRTGDAGAFDDEGHLVVTGRVRAMFNCYEGTNIDPLELEQLLEMDPYVREAILVGHRRPYLAALLVPDDARLLHEEVDDRESFLMSRIARINNGLEDFERIRCIRVVDPESTALVRQVTAAQKIRIDRDAVDRVFARDIDVLYAS